MSVLTALVINNKRVNGVVVTIATFTGFVIYAFGKNQHILFIVGTALIVIGLCGFAPYLFTKRWISIPATVISVEERYREVASSTYEKIKYYYPYIRYQYEIDGRVYDSDRVAFEISTMWVPEVDNWGTPNSEEHKFWCSISKGSVIDVFVNPQEPTESVVFNALNNNRLSHHSALVVGGVFCVVIWIIFIV